MKCKPALIAVATALSLNASAVLAEKWDMPMAYAATNYHSCLLYTSPSPRD